MDGEQEELSPGPQEETRASLEKELAGTVETLVERVSKLSVLEEQIHQVKYQMERLVGAEIVLRGDASAVVTRDAFRQTLRKKLTVLESRRAEARIEVERARGRRLMIEEEIEALSG